MAWKAAYKGGDEICQFNSYFFLDLSLAGLTVETIGELIFTFYTLNEAFSADEMLVLTFTKYCLRGR